MDIKDFEDLKIGTRLIVYGYIRSDPPSRNTYDKKEIFNEPTKCVFAGIRTVSTGYDLCEVCVMQPLGDSNRYRPIVHCLPSQIEYEHRLELSIRNSIVDKFLQSHSFETCIIAVSSQHDIPKKEAKKLLDDYMDRYKFDTCPHCGKHAVTLFTSMTGPFYADDDSQCGQEEQFYNGDSLDYIESEQEVSLFAHICMNCNEMIDVGIEYPRDLVVCTSDNCKDDKDEK